MTPEEMVNSLKSELRQLMEDGTKHNDTRVAALEERLVEAETELRSLREAALPTPNTPAAGEQDAFRGAFVKNIDELRNQLRNSHGVESRAIDSSLFGTGGKLSAEQSDTFIDYVVAQQVALSRVTTRRMNAPQGLTDELTVAARKLRAATEATAPSVSNAIGVKRRSLTTTEVIWAEDITLTFLEDNIERRGAEGHIARLLATQFGNDLNDLGWNGDVADVGADAAFLNINEGWLKIATGDADVNDVDATGATKGSDVLQSMLQAMPVKFKGRLDHAYWVGVGFAEKYADSLSTRQTALGDGVMINGFPALRYFGIPIIPEPHLAGDRAVLTPAGNLVFGVQRSFTVDSEYQPRKRVVEYTLTARIDFEYATGTALVLTANIPAAIR